MHHVRRYGPAPLHDPAAYPGRWPGGAVLVDGEHVIPVEAPHAVGDRTPVLAVGSNACPAQLHAKGIRGEVLLLPTVLRNHAVVYAGHVTDYGAVPSTVARWPGAVAHVFTTWLTPAQLAAVTESEGGNYDLVELPTDAGEVPAYRARTGILRTEDRLPIPVAGVRHEGSPLPRAMAQLEALALHRRQRAAADDRRAG